MTDTEAYIQLQKSCGIKPGDYVKVLRKAKDYECGWGTYWAEEMDNFVGKTFEVVKVDNYFGGIIVKHKESKNIYSFPFFVLQKVQKTTNLKPFDKVLVRDDENDEWEIDLFYKIGNDPDRNYMCMNAYWRYCIPYKGNEQYVGTTDNPTN